MKPSPDNLEFDNLKTAMRKIFKVSKVEMSARLEAEKKRKTKPSASPAPVVSSRRVS